MSNRDLLLRFSTFSGDRRRSPRYKTRVRVDFCPIVARSGSGLAVGKPQRGVALDVSESGLFLGEVSYLQLGVTIHLFLRLPDVPGNPIGCYAKVVRRELGGEGGRDGYAVRFFQLPETDLIRLARFVRLQKARGRRLAVA